MQSNQISSFLIRTIPTNKNNKFQNIRQTITISPTIIQFINYSAERINVVKMEIKNQSNFSKKIAIKQPFKPYFEVSLKQKELTGKQCSDIHVFFNPQKQKVYIEDQFSLKVEGQQIQIFVPIVCQYKSSKKISSSSKQLIIVNKENDDICRKSMMIKNDKVRRSFHSRKRNISIEVKNINVTDYRSGIVKQFMEKFEAISRYILQKKVKNEVYLGQSKITIKQKREIEMYKTKIEEINQNSLFQQIKSRFTIAYHESGPILQIFNGLALSWNSNSNNSSIILNNAINKLQQQIRRYTISLRFQNIKKSLQIYTEFKQKYSTQSKLLKISQYMQYYNNKTNANQTISNLNNIELQFNHNSIKKEQLLIDYENTPRNNYFRERAMILEINQRIGFDNWMPMNIIKENNQEIYMYQSKELSNHEIFMPINLRDNLRGALMELPYKNKVDIDDQMEDIFVSVLDQPIPISIQPSQAYNYSEYKTLKEQCYCYYDMPVQAHLIDSQSHLEEWLAKYIHHL